jgi:hypothetical protein
VSLTVWRKRCFITPHEALIKRPLLTWGFDRRCRHTERHDPIPAPPPLPRCLPQVRSLASYLGKRLAPLALQLINKLPTSSTCPSSSHCAGAAQHVLPACWGGLPAADGAARGGGQGTVSSFQGQGVCQGAVLSYRNKSLVSSPAVAARIPPPPRLPRPGHLHKSSTACNPSYAPLLSTWPLPSPFASFKMLPMGLT